MSHRIAKLNGNHASRRHTHTYSSYFFWVCLIFQLAFCECLNHFFDFDLKQCCFFLLNYMIKYPEKKICYTISTDTNTFNTFIYALPEINTKFASN